MHYTGHHIHTLWQQSLVFMTSHALHSWNLTHYIWHVTYCVDITFTICVTSHNDCFYDITHSMFMTYLLYVASHIVLWQHNHCVLHSQYVWYHTHCTCVITPNVSILLNPVCVWHHLHYMYVIIRNTYDITSSLYDIKTLIYEIKLEPTSPVSPTLQVDSLPTGKPKW